MRVSHTGTQAGRTAIYPLSRTHTRVTRAESGQRASLSRRASRILLTRACGIGFVRFFIFIFFKIIFYKNIFSILQFTGLYPYCPAEGRQRGLPPGRRRQAPPI